MFFMELKSRCFKSMSAKFFVDTMESLQKTLSNLSSVSSGPLFASIATLYTLIFLYFPTLFLRIIFSPVLISTGILLLTLLRFGAIQRMKEEFNSTESQEETHDSGVKDHNRSSCETNSDYAVETGLNPNPFYLDSFFEWNVGGPLEVIYEAYEGEEEGEEENDDVSNEKQEKGVSGIERYPSLSRYYPESDTDSSSDGDFPVIGGWDSPERMCFRWDEEDREGLIEIELDGKRITEFSHAEEDNLIEIDISPAGNDEFSGEKW